MPTNTHIGHGPVTISLDDVRPQPVRWLWPGFIPYGKLTVIAGDPGLGKSFITMDLAARVTRCMAFPDEPDPHGPDRGDSPREPGGVVLLNAEDDPADTLRPRLETAGAVLSRIDFLDHVRERADLGSDHDGAREFDLSLDANHLRAAIGGLDRCRLVIIDPVSAYVGRTDSYNNAQVRAMLKPLADVAADTGVAVVLVTHLRKAGEGAAVARAMGSLAFTAAARTVLMAARHPQDPDLRVLACVKSNLAPDRRAYVYSIEPGLDPDAPPRVCWQDRFTGSADELLRGEVSAPGRRMSPAVEDFGVAIDAALEQEGPLTVERVRELADALGVPWETAKNTGTKRRIGVKSERDAQGRWVWVRA